MGLFDALEKLTSAAIRTALLPVDVVVDVATMGRAVTDPLAGPATLERAKQIVRDVEDAAEEAGR